jgi:hypothetical protein
MSELFIFTDDGPPPWWLEHWMKATLARYRGIEHTAANRLLRNVAMRASISDVVSLGETAECYGVLPSDVLAVLCRLRQDGIFAISDVYDGDLVLLAALHPGPAGIPLH